MADEMSNRVNAATASILATVRAATEPADVAGAMAALTDAVGLIAIAFERLNYAETGAAMFSRWSGELRAAMPIEKRPLTRAELAARLDMAELDIPGLVARGIIPTASIAIGNSVGWPNLPDWTDKIQAKLEGLRIAHIDAGMKVPTWLQRRAAPISVPVSAAVDDDDI